MEGVYAIRRLFWDACSGMQRIGVIKELPHWPSQKEFRTSDKLLSSLSLSFFLCAIGALEVEVETSNSVISEPMLVLGPDGNNSLKVMVVASVPCTWSCY